MIMVSPLPVFTSHFVRKYAIMGGDQTSSEIRCVKVGPRCYIGKLFTQHKSIGHLNLSGFSSQQKRHESAILRDLCVCNSCTFFRIRTLVALLSGDFCVAFGQIACCRRSSRSEQLTLVVQHASQDVDLVDVSELSPPIAVDLDDHYPYVVGERRSLGKDGNMAERGIDVETE